ncbi:D-aminoacyl-tRNA deacylase [Rhodohalobacter sp. 8-1]|uniref:D-aminoacyl-tRNA deacylase n=1 Tax=Rhodohalobacter sp. 8-1 TaxID=3131972 RepID=UPI0030EE4B62
MKIVVQRVSSSSVEVNGNVTGAIKRGVMLLVGIHESDTKETIDWCCNKIVSLRIFEDENGKMNRSVADINGGILVVPQFTLYGDTSKGTRPSFINAALPDIAEQLFDQMVNKFTEIYSGSVETGLFGAMMNVSLVNDGPVTILLER